MNHLSVKVGVDSIKDIKDVTEYYTLFDEALTGWLEMNETVKNVVHEVRK